MKRVAKKENNTNRLVKTILTFICYFVYARAFTTLFGSSIAVNFIADIIFLVVIVLAYKENLKEDAENLKKK